MRSSSPHLKRSPVLPNAPSHHERCRARAAPTGSRAGELTGVPRKDHCAPANSKTLKENHITVFYREQRTTESPTRRECVHCTCSGGHLRESSILSNTETTKLSLEYTAKGNLARAGPEHDMEPALPRTPAFAEPTAHRTCGERCGKRARAKALGPLPLLGRANRRPTGTKTQQRLTNHSDCCLCTSQSSAQHPTL